MLALKISQVGNSLGIVLPKELLARLKVGKGDVLFLTEAPDGWRVTPYDPGVEQQLTAGREFMHDFRDTFRQLAK
jgi:putative addiction module antidote